MCNEKGVPGSSCGMRPEQSSEVDCIRTLLMDSHPAQLCVGCKSTPNADKLLEPGCHTNNLCHQQHGLCSLSLSGVGMYSGEHSLCLANVPSCGAKLP